MLTRTWPYGTKRVVKVLDIKPFKEKGQRGFVVVAKHRDDEAEATMLAMTEGDFAAIAPMPAVGQLRQMEFRPGGPTGAHWMLLNGEVRS